MATIISYWKQIDHFSFFLTGADGPFFPHNTAIIFSAGHIGFVCKQLCDQIIGVFSSMGLPSINLIHLNAFEFFTRGLEARMLHWGRHQHFQI